MPKEPHAKPSDIAKKSNGKEPPFPPPNKPQQCHFWVARKRRYCSLPSKLTNKFCGEHLTSQQKDNDQTSDLRVPCPYDPSHTVYAKDLDIHMKTRCNARPREPEVFFTLNVNCTLPLSQEELDFQKNIFSHKQMHSQPWIARVQLSELPKGELDALVSKAHSMYQQHVPPIEKLILKDAATESKKQGMLDTKHLDQQSSILGNMERLGMLKDKSACFVEFGAGKAELSAALKQSLGEIDGEASYVLIDRKNVRNKLDNTLLGLANKKSVVQRIMLDIKDLDLSKVQALMGENGNRRKVVALSKHLCGSATDISLKCLMNYHEKEKAAGNSEPVSGIIIALCCHQLCRYEMYPNTAYLQENGLKKQDFDRLCKMSSWAICGQRGTNASADNDGHSHGTQEEADKDETVGHYSGMDHRAREEIGYECKRALDAGRVQFLQKHGFDAKLIYYVDPSTSLENCALIAVPRSEEV